MPSQALLSNNNRESDYHGNQEATSDSNKAAVVGSKVRHSEYNRAWTPSKIVRFVECLVEARALP